MAYEMYDLADRFRAAGTPVVIGGLHASFAADEAKAALPTRSASAKAKRSGTPSSMTSAATASPG